MVGVWEERQRESPDRVRDGAGRVGGGPGGPKTKGEVRHGRRGLPRDVGLDWTGREERRGSDGNLQGGPTQGPALGGRRK